jgi:multicomponent Na+:H+ antiporter subunit C
MITGYLILALLLVGVWGVVRKRNLIKKVIGLSIVNNAIVILFLYGGALTGSHAPILVRGAADVTDPVPQALMLTAIVVGICVTALALALVYRMYQHYHTLDILDIEALVDQEHE